MQAIPEQIAAGLGANAVRLNVAVEAVEEGGLRGLARGGRGLLFLPPGRLLEHPGDALVVLVPVRVEVRHGGGL